MAGQEGSFWTAFVKFGGPQSAIDEILERSSFTLEELLDHDDILQECKYLNSSLIEYLSRPETLEKLIRYVIQKSPDEWEDHKHPSKYPYIASELFFCEVMSMLDALFEHPHLISLLFTFLAQKPPLDPSTAGYFRKVVVVLIQRKYEQLVKFINDNGVIDLMVGHIGLYSIMELLIMVGWDDGMGQVNDVKWLYEAKLVPKLVAKLDPTYEKEEDVQVNAARALVDVVVKCPPTQDSLLIRHLQYPALLQKIFTYMFSGSRSSLTNSLSIIIVLVQRDANRRGELVSLGSDQRADGPTDLTGLPDVIQQVVKHLTPLADLLKENQDPVKELLTQYGSLKPPLGETRMKAVELFLVLFRSNYPQVNAELAAKNVISSILDLFFEYEWNNMLHGLVESIIRTILDTDSLLLKKSLFEEGKFVDRVLEAYKKNQARHKEKKGCRLGYMGHLVRTCGAVAYVLDRDIKLKQTLLGGKSEDWETFVAGQLRKDNEAHNALLGGGTPAFPTDPEDMVAAAAATQQAGIGGVMYGTSSIIPDQPAGAKTDDDNQFNFDDEDDPAGVGSYNTNYGGLGEEEDWAHQTTTDWDYGATSSSSSGAGTVASTLGQTDHHDEDDHSDSSDEDPATNRAHVTQEDGSSDDDDETTVDHREKGKKKKDSGGAAGSSAAASAAAGEHKAPSTSATPSTSAAGSATAAAPGTTSSTTPATTTTATPTKSDAPGSRASDWDAFSPS